MEDVSGRFTGWNRRVITMERKKIGSNGVWQGTVSILPIKSTTRLNLHLNWSIFAQSRNRCLQNKSASCTSWCMQRRKFGKVRLFWRRRWTKRKPRRVLAANTVSDPNLPKNRSNTPSWSNLLSHTILAQVAWSVWTNKCKQWPPKHFLDRLHFLTSVCLLDRYLKLTATLHVENFANRDHQCNSKARAHILGKSRGQGV